MSVPRSKVSERDQLLPLGAREGVDPKIVAAMDRLGHAIRVQMARLARFHGLTVTQLQLLLRLRTDPPERRRVGALAAELDVTLPTVSDAISALERKGLVDRSADPEDGRGVRLVLTGRGYEVADSADAWQVRAQYLLRSVSVPDKERALGFLTGLIAELYREGYLGVARMCATCRYFRPDDAPRPQHRCVLLDLTLGPGDVRVDCPEHEPAEAAG